MRAIRRTEQSGATEKSGGLYRGGAAAVAAGLKPRLRGGCQMPTSGKGKAEPVAANTTVEGRALNRRVSVVFAPAGGAK